MTVGMTLYVRHTVTAFWVVTWCHSRPGTCLAMSWRSYVPTDTNLAVVCSCLIISWNNQKISAIHNLDLNILRWVHSCEIKQFKFNVSTMESRSFQLLREMKTAGLRKLKSSKYRLDFPRSVGSGLRFRGRSAGSFSESAVNWERKRLLVRVFGSLEKLRVWEIWIESYFSKVSEHRKILTRLHEKNHFAVERLVAYESWRICIKLLCLKNTARTASLILSWKKKCIRVTKWTLCERLGKKWNRRKREPKKSESKLMKRLTVRDVITWLYTGYHLTVRVTGKFSPCLAKLSFSYRSGKNND